MDIRVLRFKTEYNAAGLGIDWVEFTSKDAMNESGIPTHTTWEVISRLQPPDQIENDDGGLKMAAMRSQWAQIEPHYMAWKDGNELPDNGTPLAAWSGVTPEQAEVLRRIGAKSVEAVAGLTEAVLGNPPLPNLREIKRQAQAFIEGRDKSAMASEIATLREQLETALAMMAEEAAEKPRRGRPPKETEPAQEADAA
jgi:hypothetical protein